jgi:DivIVA domain-containing protein
LGPQSPESAPDPEVDRAELTGWVQPRKFSTTRLRPGYDVDEIDAFIDAIRDSFLGVREPPLTADEIRVKQFSTTRLRPGYDEEEVDAFLDQAESGLAAQAHARAHAARQRSVAADPAARAVQINDAAQPVTGDKIRDTTSLIVGGGHDMAQGRDGIAMTEDDTSWDDRPDPEVAQPQDGVAGQPRIDELELDADSVPIQNRPATSQPYLSATACLAGSLVSVGLAVTEIAEYAHYNRVGNLAILGMVIGALAGITAAAVNEQKPPGWAYRINIIAAGLALISVSTLAVFFLGQHGWGHP